MPALMLVLAGLSRSCCSCAPAGRSVTASPRSCPAGTPAVSLLRLDRLTKRFDHHGAAVDGLTLSVEPGEILALLGPSGCGKTTTLRLIAGFERLTGHGRARGQRVAGEGIAVPPEARGVGVVFQDYALFPHLSVGDNVAFGLARQERAARARRVAGGARPGRARRARRVASRTSSPGASNSASPWPARSPPPPR